jgi:hypothetical protein
MGFFLLLLVGSIIGLGPVALWWISGLNMKYTSFVQCLMQGLVVTPLLAVGGVSAFLLFAHLVGVTDVKAAGADTLSDVLIMVGVVAALGGPALGFTGYMINKKFG